MVVNKRDSPICGLQNSRKISYVANAITDGVICDIEIRRFIRIVKGTFQTFYKVHRD